MSLCHAPERVITPFTALPHDGIQSMIEKLMPRNCTQSGSAV